MKNLNQITTDRPFVKINGFQGDASLIERLREMGLHPDQKIELIGQAPLGGPKLFRISSTVLALRPQEAECVQVEAL